MRKIITIFLIIGLVIILSMISSYWPQNEKLRVIGLENHNFHNRPFKLTLNTNKIGARIYYTLDGSEPTPENGYRYQHAIEFSLPENEEYAAGKVIRVRAYSWGNREASDIWTKTYFIGPNPNDRFDLPIVALTTDPANLYDYEKGIFIEGKLRDEYRAAHPENTEENMIVEPANYNLRGRESERPVHVEIITQDQTLINQAAGLRLHGFSGRASANQKSLRLIARREYDPSHGKFKYPFYHNLTTADGSMTPITEFNKLLLRSAQNELDYVLTFIRDAVGSSVFQKMNYDTYMAARPVATYLNGTYHGISWLETIIDEDYLKTLYQTETNEFELLEITEALDGSGLEGSSYVERAPTIEMTEFEQQEISQLNELLSQNWQKAEVLAAVQAAIDLDNLIDYYSLEIALANEDWPANNLRLWRYTGQEETGKAATDGRWRFIAYDSEWSLLPSTHYGEYLKNLLGKEVSDVEHAQSNLLAKLLEIPEYQEKWLRRISDLRGTVMQTETFQNIIDQRATELGSEISHHQRIREAEHLASERIIKDRQNQMVEIMTGQEEYLDWFTSEYFHLSGKKMTVHISSVAGATLGLNSVQIKPDDEEGDKIIEYYQELKIPVRVERLAANYQFIGWEINGEFISSQTLSANNGWETWIDIDQADQNNFITIKALTEKQVDEHLDLKLSEIVNNGGNDWLEVWNPKTTAPITLNNYCLTDGKDKCKWQLPDNIILGPGEYFTFYSRNNKTEEAWREYYFNFNIKHNESLKLLKWSDQTHTWTAIDSVTVPRITVPTSFAYDPILGYWRITYHPTRGAANQF